jgi:hypothetical protein
MNQTALAILPALCATIALAAQNFKKIDEKEAAALAVYAPRPTIRTKRVHTTYRDLESPS